ncbi:hypothetical protein H0H81_012060, partial [Sphagnurus paluster]
MSTAAPQFFTNARDFTMNNPVIQNVQGDFHQYSGDPDSSELIGLAYAHGAGYNTTKQCLPGTRKEILEEIEQWALSTEPNTPRIFWLNGAAGTGKSAIAHTIALKFDQNKALGSCLCFDRTYLAERRHEKVFSTLSRDLASRKPGIKRLLAAAIQERSWLKSTSDVTQQWEFLFVKLATHLSVDGPILIVIDALDESGDARSRNHILSILATRVNQLPSNFRILLTSRPLNDIFQAFRGSTLMKSKVMDDIPNSSDDISTYIYTHLPQPEGHSTFERNEVRLLVDRSEGLFQWAYLASPTLDILYETILQPLRAGSGQAGMQRFRSVMSQILALFEPLSLDALTAIRKNFPSGCARADDVSIVVKNMGSLLSGITDQSVPVRPLHSSFHDYLTDPLRSKDFYIDTSLHRNDLAFATLHIMKAGLRFNICGLENSYLLNSDVPDMANRIQQSIPSGLSYSCRHWASHLRATSFGSKIANLVREFLNEQFLFWIEVLSLIKSVQSAAAALSSIMKWII